MSSPIVSVIIPVRDNSDGIRQVLRCLGEQTIPRTQFEVVIGDDGSRPELAPRVEDENGWVRVVRIRPQNSYAARNAAARVARGSILAFCDSDCLPEPRWLEEALAVIGNADILAGEVKFVPPAQPTVWSLLTADLFLDQKQNVSLSRGVTANLLVRRQLFMELNGFDESLPSGGDYDFVERAVGSDARVRYAPCAAVLHPTIDERRPFLRKIWNTNRWSGVRNARGGASIDMRGVLILAPVAGGIIARRLALRPVYRLDEQRLERSSITVSFGDHARAMTMLHTVVCYVAGAGRIAGWLEGRRMAEAGLRPKYGVAPEESAQES